MKKIITYFIGFLLYISLVKTAFSLDFPSGLSCKAVGIRDGDTFSCLQKNQQLTVRLAHIDAPELGQAYGQRAKQALSRLIFQQPLTLTPLGYDKYQRILAIVYDQQGRNVNLALIEQGMAWTYQTKLTDYQQAQQQAQLQRVGLWQDPKPTHPAEWRAYKRSHSSKNLQNSAQNQPLATVNCNIKLSCAQIGHFKSAQRYFQQCGWKELDGNNDGIPCNKLYRKEQHND